MSDTTNVEAPSEQPSQAPIVVDPNLIAAIVSAVVQQIGAVQHTQAPFSMDELGKTIGESVARGIAATTRRKVTIGEYVQTGHSSFHPRPKAETPVLRRNCFDNGAWLNPQNLFDEEVELLNQISHSGRYFDRKMEVIVTHDGTDEIVQFRHSDQTPDQRFDMAQYYGFVKGKHKTQLQAMLQQIVSEQMAEDEDARETAEINTELRRQARERNAAKAGGIGRSKAYREAKAAADAKLADAQAE